MKIHLLKKIHLQGNKPEYKDILDSIYNEYTQDYNLRNVPLINKTNFQKYKSYAASFINEINNTTEFHIRNIKPSLEDNLARIHLPLNYFAVDVLMLELNNPSITEAVVFLKTEDLFLKATIGNYLVLSLNESTAETFIVEINSEISIVSYTE